MSMIINSNFTVPAVMLTFCVLLVVKMILLNIRKHQNIKPIPSQQKVKQGNL
jgi:ABC-type xylose transport system permease subunit